MKVYRITTNVNSYQYFLTENEADVLRLHMDCTPRLPDWSPPGVYIYRPRLTAGDFYSFSSSALITSPRATTILGPFLERAGELLPLPYRDQTFTLLNVTECIDCLDHERCEWRYSQSGARAYPTKYVFNPARFSSSRIFKIPETYRAEVLVVDLDQGDDEEFRAVVEQAGLQGLIFEEIWNDQQDQPPAPRYPAQLASPRSTMISLPVRWWSDNDSFGRDTLELVIAHTALVLIDCDGPTGPEDYNYTTKRDMIAPALAAARQAGLTVAYFHSAPGGEGGPNSQNNELHGLREDKQRALSPGWKPSRPEYPAELAPRGLEPEFQKAHRNGFRDTFADQYFRTWGIDTLIMVGFSLESCLYHTCAGAHENNYRVVVLRDAVCPPGTKEYPDTHDPANPEGGWMRFAMLRLIESNLGYTATTADFVAACGEGS